MKSSRNYTIEQVVVNIVLNFAIAYYIGKYTLANKETIPLWADTAAPFDPNMAGDILVGTFILSFLITLILSAITRFHLRKENIETQELEVITWIKRLPNSLFKRSLAMAVLATVFVGLVALLFLVVVNITAANVTAYIIIHSTYAGILAGAVAYIVTKRALFD